jgi:glycine cleavage system aminomethyltransferase T
MSSLLKRYLDTDIEMIDIAGVQVAWQIGDYEQEYDALRNAAGLMDLSYGGPIRVSGPSAMEILNQVLTRDLEFVAPERAFTSLVLSDDGSPIDIVTVLGAANEEYLVQCSPGRNGQVLAALRASQALFASGDDDTELEDLSDTMSVIAVEGPYAWQVIQNVLGDDYIAIAYEAVLPAEVNEMPVTVSRTGLTGEYGYTLFAPNEVAADLWSALAAHSTIVGQRALETAMLEVRQPLAYRECAEGQSVVSAGLNWLVDLTKADFTGRDALLAQRAAGEDRRPIGFRVEDGLVAPGDPLFVEDEHIGEVGQVVDSPTLGCRIGLASVAEEWQAARLTFTTAAQARIQTLAAPYITPASWTTPIQM